MRKVLAYAGDLGLTVISHAEDGGVTAGAVATAGETATRMGLPSAPAIAESLAIARDLMLAEETGGHLPIRQGTTAAGFDLVRAAKPARVLGLDTGTLAVGAPADLLLLDAQAPWQIDADRMIAKAGNTPFDGLPVQGKVLRLFKGGSPLA